MIRALQWAVHDTVAAPRSGLRCCWSLQAEKSDRTRTTVAPKRLSSGWLCSSGLSAPERGRMAGFLDVIRASTALTRARHEYRSPRLTVVGEVGGECPACPRSLGPRSVASVTRGCLWCRGWV